MKKINIKKLSLINFKGVEKLDIVFSDNTNISGDNATGKTTIFDAVTWLLFGKDSQDRKDFDIKNTVKKELNRRDHIVSAILEVDGKTTEIKRVYKEKWVKPRGQAEEVFSGHETDFFVDLVPKNQKEYQEYISSIVNEELFKLITSPSYFTSLHWEKQRTILLGLAGDINDSIIANGNSDFVNLLEELSGKSLSDYKKMIAAQKKLLKDNIITIQPRIEECERQIPAERDYKVIENRLLVINQNISDLQVQIGNIQKQSEAENNAVIEIQNKINSLNLERNAIVNKLKNDAQAELFKKEAELAEIDNKFKTVSRNSESKKSQINILEDSLLNDNKELDNLRQQFTTISSETYQEDENSLICPTCKQSLPDVSFKRESMQTNFNQNKAERLNKINQKGILMKEQIEKTKKEIEEKKSELSTIIAEINTISEQRKSIESGEIKPVDIESAIANNKEIVAIDIQIKQLSESLQNRPSTESTSVQVVKIKTLTSGADELKLQLNERKQKETLQRRIVELEEELRTQNVKLATFEGKEFIATLFEKAKMEYVENKVNAMFAYVKFKLFETQINGGEKPICEANIGDVPFSVLNNAKRINAGIDIINTLCNFYNVSAPIIIDNAESVNELIYTKSQIIRLIVSLDNDLVIKYA